MANEGQVRLEAVGGPSFDEMAKRIEGVEQGLVRLERRAKTFGIDVDTTGLEKAKTEIRKAGKELGRLTEEAEEAEGGLDNLGSGSSAAAAGIVIVAQGLAAAAVAIAAFAAVLVAAGAAALKEFITDLFEVGKEIAALERTLASANLEGEQLDQLSQKASELGREFKDLAPGYVDFMRTVAQQNIPLEEGNALWDSWAVALTGAGASAADTDSVIRRIGEALERGQVSQEDWNAAADAGIDINKILAASYGEQASRIKEFREQGLVPAREELALIAPELLRAFGPQARENADDLLGVIARYENTLAEIRKELATKLSPEFEEWLTLFTKIGEDGASILSKLVDGLVWVSDTTQESFIAMEAAARTFFEALAAFSEGRFADLADMGSFTERFKTNLAAILVEQNQAEAKARAERVAADQAEVNAAVGRRQEALGKIEALLAQQTESEKRAAAAFRDLLGGADAGERAAVTVPVELDLAAFETQKAVLVAKIAELEAAFSEAFRAGDTEGVSRLTGELIKVKRELIGLVPAAQAAGPAFDTVTEPAQRQEGILRALSAVIASLGPVWNKATADQRTGVASQVASLATLAESGKVTQAALLAFAQFISETFPALGGAIAESLGQGTTAAGDLQAQIDALTASTNATAEAQAAAGEGTINWGDQVIELGGKLEEEQERVITWGDRVLEIGKKSEEATGGTIKFGEQVTQIGERGKEAAEAAANLAEKLPEAGKAADQATKPADQAATAADKLATALGGAATGAGDLAGDAASAETAVADLGEIVSDTAEEIHPNLSDAISSGGGDRQQLAEDLKQAAESSLALKENLAAIAGIDLQAVAGSLGAINQQLVDIPGNASGALAALSAIDLDE